MKFFAIFAAVVAVAVASADVSTWTLNQLSDAIQSPSTNPALMPYLENALNLYMDSLFAGHDLEAITVVTPAGLVPIEGAAAAIDPAPALADKPEVSAASSPLVQIIINVAGNEQSAAPALVPAPAVVPSPAGPVAPIVTPEPVSVVEVAPEAVSVAEIAPEPVTVIEVAPEPVSVVEVAPEPVSVVEVAPETVAVAEPAPIPESVVVAGPINPIDVIAVGAPEVNPIDILAPIIVTPVIAGGDIVGPIV